MHIFSSDTQIQISKDNVLTHFLQKFPRNLTYIFPSPGIWYIVAMKNSQSSQIDQSNSTVNQASCDHCEAPKRRSTRTKIKSRG